ncbi:MAG: helix-turn-helix domain-containing protein [Pseudomonadales bacterium]
MKKRRNDIKSIQLILQMLDAYGVDLGRLLRSLEIPYVGSDPIYGIVLPINSAQYRGLQGSLEDAIQQKKSKHQEANVFGPDHFSYMCYGLIHCNTLGEAIERSIHFFHLFSGHRGKLRLQNDSGNAYFRVSEDDHRLPLASDALEWHRLLMFYGWLIRRPFPLSRVDFPTTIDSVRREKLAIVFRVTTFCNGADTCFTFPSVILSEPIRQTESTLEKFLANRRPTISLSSMHLTNLDEQILAIVEQKYEGQFPSCATFARHLHMSESKLRRLLKQQGSSYQQIKDSYRQQRAEDLLINSNTPISNMADVLGYAEAVSFQRAFQRWTGLNPRDYRRKFRR